MGGGDEKTKYVQTYLHKGNHLIFLVCHLHCDIVLWQKTVNYYTDGTELIKDDSGVMGGGNGDRMDELHSSMVSAMPLTGHTSTHLHDMIDVEVIMGLAAGSGSGDAIQ